MQCRSLEALTERELKNEREKEKSSPPVVSFAEDETLEYLDETPENLNTAPEPQETSFLGIPNLSFREPDDFFKPFEAKANLNEIPIKDREEAEAREATEATEAVAMAAAAMAAAVMVAAATAMDMAAVDTAADKVPLGHPDLQGRLGLRALEGIEEVEDQAELKPEQFPEWDGDPDTALQYFWEVLQMGSMGGYISEAMGFWLGSRLKKGTVVYSWYMMLPEPQQAYMRVNHFNFLRTLKEVFLGRLWQLEMNRVFETQSFRQDGCWQIPTTAAR
ncbi:hypothetical protein C8R46DRAFT_1208084 [Mycena filopes]|nr:hypothetical protein C8R46DRAFT_1208084 [Mycena filopes]